ncbi:MAG: hypothetical protein K2X82_04865 [Gemmataceae bacterium]|nr:hypothetical protein [Gemmataceae bacterium]
MARAKAAENGDGTVSQADMVRDALAALGANAKPRAIQAYVQEKHGKELSRIIISNYKSNMKKGRLGGLGGGRARGAGRPRKAAGAGTGGSVRLDDLEAVRGLVSRLGAANVRRLVDVLA